jgi:hypothetical protein
MRRTVTRDQGHRVSLVVVRHGSDTEAPRSSCRPWTASGEQPRKLGPSKRKPKRAAEGAERIAEAS